MPTPFFVLSIVWLSVPLAILLLDPWPVHAAFAVLVGYGLYHVWRKRNAKRRP